MPRLYVGPLSHDTFSKEVATIAASLRRSDVRSVLVTVAFGLDPENPIFGAPVPVTTDRLPEYVQRLEDDGLCELGQANITVEVPAGDIIKSGAEVFFLNDMDMIVHADEGPFLADVRDRWVHLPNYQADLD